MRSKSATMSNDFGSRKTCNMHFSRFLVVNFPKSQMLRLANFKNNWTFLYEKLFFSAKNLQLVQTVVFRWKSKSSAFQNTKNHWNRLIIRDDRSNLVLESINCTCSHVFWCIGTYGSLPYVPMYQNTCEHVGLLDSNTKFDLSSRIINRFQRFFDVLKSWGVALSPKNNSLHQL